MADEALASLSLTHVSYNPDDPISYVAAWLALVPQALCVIYITLIWASREAEILLMFGGQMACEAVNFGLKRWIKEERPRQMNGKGYGMPSSHAQFVCFFSISLSLFLLFRHRPRPTATYTTTSLIERFILSLVACTNACFVAASRVYLNYHTSKQVLVGCAAGVLFATIWFMFTSYLRRSGWVEWALGTRISQLLRMRDLCISEDIMDAGWGRWQERRAMTKRRVQNGSVRKHQ